MTTPLFIVKQCQMAFTTTTPDLSNLERDIAVSAEKAQGIEEAYFAEFCESALALADDISRVARGLAAIDVATSIVTLR